MPARPVLTATLFNRPRFHLDGRALAIKSRKAEALLAYLCMCPGGTVMRSAAIGLLWGDKPEAQARSSLRQTVLILNKAFRPAGFDGFRARKTEIALEPASFDTDVNQILASIGGEAPIHPRLLQQRLSSDDLLEGFDNVDDQFLVWLRVQRQTIHDRIRSELEDRQSRAPSGETRRQILQALLNVDPSHEPACRAVMLDRAARGDLAGAISEYNKLYDYLGEAFDNEPSAETRDLLARIKLGNFCAPRPAPTAAGDVAANGPSLAANGNVKPRIIIDNTEVSDLAHNGRVVASVFRQDLISRLVRFREWSVVEPSAATTTDPQIPLYRLSSSAIVQDDRMKLSLNLQDVHNACYVWSDDYTLATASLYEHQTAIVSRIAAGINVHISTMQLSRAEPATPLTADNYHRWLAAQSHHFRHSPDDFMAAVDIYQHLIEEQPLFAPGYSSYAQTLNSRHLVYVGETRSPVNLKRARELSHRAQELDPFDSRSHLCAAWNAMLLGRFDDAVASLRLAYDLNENDPWTAVSVAAGLAMCGRTDMARELAQRAVALGFVMTPMQWGYLTGLWFMAGDYARAADAFTKAIGTHFNSEPWGVAALAMLGDLDTAHLHCAALVDRARRRWAASKSPDRDAVAAWIVDCFPLADPDARARLMAGLEAAGLHA